MHSPIKKEQLLIHPKTRRKPRNMQKEAKHARKKMHSLSFYYENLEDSRTSLVVDQRGLLRGEQGFSWSRWKHSVS